MTSVNKCSPFKKYLKTLKKYLKKTDPQKKSKMMMNLSELENELIVPEKYRFNDISKSKKRRTRISPP